MSNIFKKRTDFVQKPNLSVKDRKFINNFSTEIGRLTPTLCREVLPGEVVKIDASVGMRAMPMVFPIQTPVRMHTHLFYVPNRILCDEWEDFITGVKQTDELPYIFTNDVNFFKTGSLADFLGVPTSIASDKVPQYVPIMYNDGSNHDGYNTATYFGYTADTSATSSSNFGARFATLNALMSSRVLTFAAKHSLCGFSFKPTSSWNGVVRFDVASGTSSLQSGCVYAIYSNGVFFAVKNVPLAVQTGGLTAQAQLSSDNLTAVQELLSQGKEVTIVLAYALPYSSGFQNTNVPFVTRDIRGAFQAASYVNINAGVQDATQVFTSLTHPFCKAQINIDHGIKISSLPFRAYEMIYNAYYRNELNNPLLIDGNPEYNKYLTNSKMGADEFAYDFHYRNWELDQYTSAVQSPQFGVAPLVGLSVSPDAATATLTFADIDVTLPDGSSEHLESSDMVVSVDATTGYINGIKDAKGVPSGNISQIMDAIGYGISINDFRNVNSFQRYLENAIRIGYKYRDQMLSHFGIDVGYKDIWMPEFIGGFSVDFNVDQINQTVGTDAAPLGDFAGQGNFIGGSKHTITKRIHEHGYIMAITSIIPLPVYTQTLPKMFTRQSRFDFYTPEFSKIGYQPIFMSELAPLQTGYGDFSRVFGYNRAWYDYIGSLDEAHGLFRVSLKDFLMMRQFSSSPELGESFITCHPEEVNDVFAVRQTDLVNNAHDDKFIGVMVWDYKSASPVPTFGIPALE